MLAGEYVDQASGKTANRPEFQRLLRDAAERKFDLVLFWSLDRFTREGVLETLQHLQRLTGKSIACSFFRNQQKPRVSADFGDFFACVYRFGECERFNGGPLGGHADVGVAFEHFLVNVLGEGFHPRMVRPL
jgi:hypothetical protein